MFWKKTRFLLHLYNGAVGHLYTFFVLTDVCNTYIIRYLGLNNVVLVCCDIKKILLKDVMVRLWSFRPLMTPETCDISYCSLFWPSLANIILIQVLNLFKILASFKFQNRFVAEKYLPNIKKGYSSHVKQFKILTIVANLSSFMVIVR